MGKIYILSPFENKMAKRGTRHPMLAEMLARSGHAVEYVTTNFSHGCVEKIKILANPLQRDVCVTLQFIQLD